MEIECFSFKSILPFIMGVPFCSPLQTYLSWTVEKKGNVWPAPQGGLAVYLLNQFLMVPQNHPLIDGGGINISIGNNPLSGLQGRVVYLSYMLGPVSCIQKKLR